jgi:NAD(P)-dependent dehydrogenase (short-subunit alcohol dehydrogenase family)
MARKLAIVTGATGGIGRQSAARLGAAFDLFLTDVDVDRLDSLASQLRGEGLTVSGTRAVDLAQDGAVAELLAAAMAAGVPGALLHAAGLSPALAGSEAILRTNLLLTEQLLRALDETSPESFVAVLIASIAGHTALPPAIVEAMAGDPLQPGYLDHLMHALGGPMPPELAYCVSKRWVVQAPAPRAAAWGKRGARIVSISPGLIDTPMGRAEIAASAGSRATLDMTPLGWGQPSDIAAAAAFLCSPEARFITGCDLLVDGGVLPAMRAMMG